MMEQKYIQLDLYQKDCLSFELLLIHLLYFPLSLYFHVTNESEIMGL